MTPTTTKGERARRTSGATSLGIRDWEAKKGLLRGLYNQTTDKALVAHVVEEHAAAERIQDYEKGDIVDKLYDTYLRWGQSTPKGEKSRQFWDWIISDHGVSARGPQLWSCSIDEFIECFPPAEADIALAVSQLITDDRACPDPGMRKRLCERFIRRPHADPNAAGALFPRYPVWTTEAMRFEGPLTGIRSGRIQVSQFYSVPEAATAWTTLVDSQNYRMYLECLLSLKQLVKSSPWLQAIESGRHHVAVMLGGGGSPEKDWVVAGSLLRAVREQLEFVIVDISKYMIDASAGHLRRRLAKEELSKRVSIQYEQCDFLTLEERFTRRHGWQLVVWTLLGGTIGNVLEREFFRSIKGPSRIGDLLVVGVDTLDGSSDAQLEERMDAQYRSKELDRLLVSPVYWPSGEVDESQPRVRVTTVAGRDPGGNLVSNVPNTRTAVFSLPPSEGHGPIILATSTRYPLEDFLNYARRFGWEHLGTEHASPDSTFRQLLFRRVE